MIQVCLKKKCLLLPVLPPYKIIVPKLKCLLIIGRSILIIIFHPGSHQDAIFTVFCTVALLHLTSDLQKSRWIMTTMFRKGVFIKKHRKCKKPDYPGGVRWISLYFTFWQCCADNSMEQKPLFWFQTSYKDDTWYQSCSFGHTEPLF